MRKAAKGQPHKRSSLQVQDVSPSQIRGSLSQHPLFKGNCVQSGRLSGKLQLLHGTKAHACCQQG